MPETITCGPITRVRNREYIVASDGTQWKRQVKADSHRTEWEPVSPPLQPQVAPTHLMLVLQNQAEGEPKHWRLFVGREGQAGAVYQVTGDATYMSHNFAENVDVFSSDGYHTSYVLAQLQDNDQATIAWHAGQESPPRAENRASVTENCQGWTIRVLKRLQAQGIVDMEWATFAEGIKEAV